ncbi:MAG: hypothetical protein HYX74_08155 [Acidobacteria bacterium]|nr:hypothetical protein [Acidobacteriota bacterium]
MFARCRKGRLLLLLISAALTRCGDPGEARIETLGEKPEQLAYRMESLTGMRDGDVLRARLVFTAESARVVADMLFRIGVPTRLESGRYSWEREGRRFEGPVREVSVTFLGGQSDRPSLGGIFLLLRDDGVPLSRIVLPTTLVARQAR